MTSGTSSRAPVPRNRPTGPPFVDSALGPVSNTEIVPADQIKQIGRLTEKGFGRDAGPSGEQAAYDALLTHLLESPVAANDWSLGGNEGPLAELLVLTKDGRLLHIEVIGTAGVAKSPTAIIIHAKGHGARIDVKDFKHPERKK